MMKTRLIIAADLDALAVKAAELFKTAARTHVDRRGRFAAALSGGSTPRAMYRLLARPPLLVKVPWERTHLFWVDERCVPAGDRESNLGAAWRDLLQHLPLPRENLHYVRGDFPPEEAVEEYHLELISFFQPAPGEFPVFDLIYLGMGRDGHTASLFPDSFALREEHRMVATVKGGTPNLHRVTLTLPVLNRARQIVFLVAGGEKAETVKAVLEGDRPDLPAAQIKPADGELIWLLDQEAAALLDKA